MKNASRKLLKPKNLRKDNYITFSPSNDECSYNNITKNKQNYILNNNDNNSSSFDNKIIKDEKQINKNEKLDPRLQLAFKYLNIEKILPIFSNKNINFTDLLLLSRNDLIDLGLSMIDRNRILYFSSQFLKFGKNYTIDEINLFFQINQNLYNNNMTKNNNNNNKDNNNCIINSENLSNRNNKNKKNENELFYYSNGFESNNVNINNDNEKDSQQEIDYCNVFPGDRLSQSRTNTSSKNNINTSLNKKNYFRKYQELTQEVDKYMSKFNVYKQNWFDSRKKYDNIMSSYLFRGKSIKTNKNYKKIKKKNNNYSENKIRNKNSINEKESFDKLKLLKERKDELKKKLEKIEDKSNQKKILINYLDENS